MKTMELHTPIRDTYVVPAQVEEMADVILTAFGAEDPGLLREAIDAEPEQPLQPAMERWLLQQMDLQDRDVAKALFRLFVARLQEQVEVATCV